MPMAGRPGARDGALRIAATVSLLALLSGCAARVVPTPVVTTPRYPDFIFPAVPPGHGTALAAEIERAWLFLQAGDLRTAEQEFIGTLRRSAGFYPAEVGLGYIELAESDFAAAVTWFDRGLAQAASYVPALVGRGEALMGAEREDEALGSFEAALALDPSLAPVRRRVGVLRVRGLQRNVEEARTAATAGRDAEAVRSYERAIAASSESAFLYSELAVVEQRQGRVTEALEHVWRAIALDPRDAGAHVTLGELHEARGEYDEAIEAYASANGIEPRADLAARIERVASRAELARLPEEFRTIPSLSAVTRADVAALLGVRLRRMIESTNPTGAALITDTRGHWAAPWIMVVASAGLMEVYPNHTFEPEAGVNRGELAEVVSRTLGSIAARAPALARQWEAAPATFADLGQGHLSYPAASRAVAAGILPALEGGRFERSRPVAGTEVIEAIDRLKALASRVAGLPVRQGVGR